MCPPTRCGADHCVFPKTRYGADHCVFPKRDVGADLCVRPTRGVPNAASNPMGVSLRLPHFDYTSAGGYFVTITVHERRDLLGSLDKSRGGVTLNDAGRMVERWWLELLQKSQPVTLDAHAVMPDHFHGIVLLQCSDNTSSDPAPSLSTIIQWFKTMTTAEYFRGVRGRSWPRVNGRLWQRGFYDHIIRSERDLAAIRAYIEGNSGALLDRSGGGHTGPPHIPEEIEVLRIE